MELRLPGAMLYSLKNHQFKISGYSPVENGEDFCWIILIFFQGFVLLFCLGILFFFLPTKGANRYFKVFCAKYLISYSFIQA